MRKSQANRAVIAARTSRHNKPNHSSMPLGSITVVTEQGNVRDRTAPKMTKAQRNSIGRYSEWNMSPYAPAGGWR